MVTFISEQLAAQTPKAFTEPATALRSEDPSVRCLLDTISSIIATEYARTVRQNPKVFMTQGEDN